MPRTRRRGGSGILAFFGIGKKEQSEPPAEPPGSKLLQYTTQQNYSSPEQQERMGKGLTVKGITNSTNLQGRNSNNQPIAPTQTKSGGSRRRRRKSIRRKKRFV